MWKKKKQCFGTQVGEGYDTASVAQPVIPSVFVEQEQTNGSSLYGLIDRSLWASCQRIKVLLFGPWFQTQKFNHLSIVDVSKVMK